MKSTCLMATDAQALFFVNRELEHPTGDKDVLANGVFNKTKVVISKDTGDEYHLSLEFFDVPRNIYDNGRRLSSPGSNTDYRFVKYVVTDTQLSSLCTSEERGQEIFEMIEKLKDSDNMVLRYGSEDKPCGYDVIRKNNPIFGSEFFTPKTYEHLDFGKYLQKFDSILDNVEEGRKNSSSRIVRVAYTLEPTTENVVASEVNEDEDAIKRIAELTGVEPIDGAYRQGFRLTCMVACDEMDITNVTRSVGRGNTLDLVTNPYIYNYRGQGNQVRHDIFISPQQAADLIEFSRSKLDEKTGIRTGVMDTIVAKTPRTSANMSYRQALTYTAKDIDDVYKKCDRGMYGRYRGQDIKDLNPVFLHFAFRDVGLDSREIVKRPAEGFMRSVLIPDKVSSKLYSIGVPTTPFDLERHNRYIQMSNRVMRQGVNDKDTSHEDNQRDDENMPFGYMDDDVIPF